MEVGGVALLTQAALTADEGHWEGHFFKLPVAIIDDFTSPQEAHITQTVAPFMCKSLIIKLNVA